MNFDIHSELAPTPPLGGWGLSLGNDCLRVDHRSVESEHIGTKKTLDMVLMANVWRSSTKRMSSVTNYAAGWRVIDAE